MKQIDEKQLLLAVGEVGDDLIARAEQPVKQRPVSTLRWGRWGALAACFCLIAVLAVLPGRLGTTTGENMAGPPQSSDINSGGTNEESAVNEGEKSDDTCGQPIPGDPGGTYPSDELNAGTESADPEGPGCDADQNSPPVAGSKGELVLIAPSEASLQATYIHGGQVQETTVTGEALDALRAWAADLAPGLEARTFAAGSSPGDSDGGAVYDFAAPDGETAFAYVINGPSDCWVLLDGRWYAVSAPADPPVMFDP